MRWEQLDEDFAYDANQLDRDVVAADQIRTVIRTFRDKLFTEIFPGRTEVPKTLIFAKDDSHAEDIVGSCREEFGKGNDFCQKITYRTDRRRRPEDSDRRDFRNSYNPRIAVTVDMIATGTDIKPLEIVFFMRAVKIRSLLRADEGPRRARDQDGRPAEPSRPTPRPRTTSSSSTAVGVCERDKTDSRPMDQKKSVPFDKLLQAVALGNTEPEVLSSVAARLARLDKTLTADDKAEIAKLRRQEPRDANQRIGEQPRRATAIVEQAKPDNSTRPAHREQAAGRRQADPSSRQAALRPERCANLLIDSRQRTNRSSTTSPRTRSSKPASRAAR